MFLSHASSPCAKHDMNKVKCVSCVGKGCAMIDTYPPCHAHFSLLSFNPQRPVSHNGGRTGGSFRPVVDRKAVSLSLTLTPGLTDIGEQAHMQTMPTVPLLTPLPFQSSRSSSIFLEQTVDAAEEVSRQSH